MSTYICIHKYVIVEQELCTIIALSSAESENWGVEKFDIKCHTYRNIFLKFQIFYISDTWQQPMFVLFQVQVAGLT